MCQNRGLGKIEIFWWNGIYTHAYYTGVGVDIRVDHAVIFGLADTPENILQEGGRPKRGVGDGSHGFAFFYHKGVTGKYQTTFNK